MLVLKKKTTKQRIRRRAKLGFTLIEAALTTVIVGTGVLAIVSAQQAFHRENMWAQRSSTGMVLANELRELTLAMPMHDPISHDITLGPEDNEESYLDFDDVDDFAGTVAEDGSSSGMVFDPPINALKQQIDDMQGWSQEIKVSSVFESDISSSLVQPLGSTDIMRVSVTIYFQQPNRVDAKKHTIAQLSWVIDN